MTEHLQYSCEEIFPGVHFVMSQEHMRLLLILGTHTREYLKSLTFSCCVYIAKSCLFLASPSANWSISEQRETHSPNLNYSVILSDPTLAQSRANCEARSGCSGSCTAKSWTALGMANPQPVVVLGHPTVKNILLIFRQNFLSVANIFCPSSFCCAPLRSLTLCSVTPL